MIVGVLGKKFNGKDTVADFLVETWGFEKRSFAGPLKEACKILFGLSEDQVNGDKKVEVDEQWGVTPRKILQFVGTDLFRRHMQEMAPWIEDKFWVQLVINQYQKLAKDNPDVLFVVSDVRFQNEVNMIHELGGKVIKVVRPGIADPKDEHPSERGIDEIHDFDYLLPNDREGDIPALYVKIKKLFEEEFGKSA